MKTPTQSFIEDAIAGGCVEADQMKQVVQELRKQGKPVLAQAVEDTIFLERKAWQATGKTRGWRAYDDTIITTYRDPENKHRNVHQRIPLKFSWRWHLHEFTTQIADGKTIDGALASLQQ